MKNFEPVIAASILSADFARLGDEVTAVLEAGADWVHFDVMDNHYVPNLTIGPMVCQALRTHGIMAPIDVHLMVKPVDEMISAFAKAGATQISIHPESTEHLDRSLGLITDSGCSAGVVLNPATPIHFLEQVWHRIDRVLLMTVNPGFGGQAFLPHSLEKIKAVRRCINAQQQAIRLQVDGGVKADNIGDIMAAGADTFVMGSAIFNTPNYTDTLQQLRQRLAPV